MFDDFTDCYCFGDYSASVNREVGCGCVDWIGLAQDRDRWWAIVSAVMNLRVPFNAGNFLTSCKPVSFSRRTLLHGVMESTVQRTGSEMKV
jgi:hypothetical protein